MGYLYWKHGGELSTLPAKEFASEDALEEYLWENQELLGEITLFARQTRTGNHRDIPDLIGIDSDNNVVVIELKNCSPSEEVVAQVLRYAIWAETNPVSIKNMWLEFKDKPDDLEVDWDSISVRIMIVAPSFPTGVLRLVNRITYSTELVEVSRFGRDDDEVVLMNLRAAEPVPRTTVARPMGTYDEAWYRQDHDGQAVDLFMQAVRWLEAQAGERAWSLQTKFNKNYVCLKYGGLNAAGVEWSGIKTAWFFFRMDEAQAQALQAGLTAKTTYSKEWSQLYCRVTDAAGFDELMPAFEAAYRRLAES